MPALRTRQVLVVDGITAPEMRMIQPHEFTRVTIDERYQRLKLTHLVNDLIQVLKNGGSFYDPATICERANDPNLYIVDGQQRFWASDALQMPLPAMLYKSAGWKAEAQLFEAMNTRRNVNANITVKGHIGASAEMLRDLADREGSPYFNNVDLGQAGRRPYGALTIVRGMLAAIAGIIPSGMTATQACFRCDHALQNDPGGTERGAKFLQLLPLVFPATNRLHTLPTVGLGRVAYRRFKADHGLPSPRTYERLKKINWEVLTDGHNSLKYLPVIEAEIERIWSE
jgi:hypothetical protein